jgi:hypothetical protein
VEWWGWGSLNISLLFDDDISMWSWWWWFQESNSDFLSVVDFFGWFLSDQLWVWVDV